MPSLNGIFFDDTATSARPLVLVHGYTCDHTDWDKQREKLKSRFRIIRIDLNGHGNSAPSEPTVEKMGAEVADIFAHLNLHNAVVAGHSMGTRIIVEAARHQSVELGGIIMVDGSRGASSAEHLQRVKEIRQSVDFAEYASKLFGQMFSDRTPDRLRDSIVARAVAMNPEWAMTLHTNVAEYDAFKLPETLAAIDLPMQVIQATTRDDAGGRRMLKANETTAYTDFLAGTFSREPSRVDIMVDTGHFPQIDAPETLNQLMTDFIDSLHA